MELENESRDHLRGETILGLNEVVLHGGAIQSLGPFPIGANGEQAMLVLRADFGPTDESMFGVIETRFSARSRVERRESIHPAPSARGRARGSLCGEQGAKTKRRYGSASRNI
jgi:hypothetical protein